MPALRPRTSVERDERRARRADIARFFGTWIRKPMSLGAVAPSSARYCARMADTASTDLDGPILELGPGLGVVTRALLAKGVDPRRITSIEYDADFARTLRDRFPLVNVVQGDGFDLDRTLGDGGRTRYAAILMAIPVAAKPQSERQALFLRYLDRLLPGGNITQLSYLVTPPVKPMEGLLEVSSTPIVWDNIPPARVWVYCKPAARSH